MAAPVAWLTGTPLVVARRNVIGSRMDHARWPLSRVGPRAERTALVVTANSRAAAAFARARGIVASRIRVVPNGHPQLGPVALPSVEGGIVFGCVARFRAEKGHHRLLDALALIESPGPWEVRFAGDGPLLEEIRRRSRELGLARRTTFAGAVDDIRGFWTTCHVATLTSDHEGQPNALIEAAFAGRAAVATAVGGSPEVVAPDGGLLVEPEDVPALAAALVRFIEEPGLAARLGAQAHRQAAERFSAVASQEGHVAAVLEALT